MRPSPPPVRDVEIERKVVIRSLAQGRALVAALPATSKGPERRVRVRDTYLDTKGRDLLAAGYGLRVRRTSDRTEATWKGIAPADAEGVREVEERTVRCTGPVRDAGSLPAGPIRRAVRRVAGDRALVPLATVAGVRTRRRLRVDAELVVETSLDRMRLAAGGAHGTVLELEVELVRGDPRAFRAWLGRAWAGRRLPAAPPSKLERAIALARLRAPSPLRIAAARLALEPVDGATPSARAAARGLAAAAAELERAVAAARRGGPEGVHEVRTLTRRVRGLLLLHGPDLDDADAAALRTPLRRLRRACGPVRDADVLTRALREAELPDDLHRGRDLLLDALRARREPARRALARALAAPAVTLPSARVAAIVAGLARRASLPLRVAAALRLPRIFERLLAARAAAGPRLRDAAPTKLHELRIAAKRVRHALEASEPGLRRPVRRAARRVRAFLDDAGACRDGAAHAEAVRRLALEVPRLAGERREAERAAERLAETFDATARTARARLDAGYEAIAGRVALAALLGRLARRAGA